MEASKLVPQNLRSGMGELACGISGRLSFGFQGGVGAWVRHGAGGAGGEAEHGYVNEISKPRGETLMFGGL